MSTTYRSLLRFNTSSPKFPATGGAPAGKARVAPSALNCGTGLPAPPIQIPGASVLNGPRQGSEAGAEDIRRVSALAAHAGSAGSDPPVIRRVGAIGPSAIRRHNGSL